MSSLWADIRSIREAIDTLHIIVLSKASWEIKYDLVFTQLNPILDALSNLGITVVWTDPDTSYEADTMAVVDALYKVSEELERVLDGVQE